MSIGLSIHVTVVLWCICLCTIKERTDTVNESADTVNESADTVNESADTVNESQTLSTKALSKKVKKRTMIYLSVHCQRKHGNVPWYICLCLVKESKEMYYGIFVSLTVPFRRIAL